MQRVDEHSLAVIADCEWALGGGTERMAAEAFHDWIFDVLEAWASEGETALVNLGTELLEGVTVPARHRQRPVGADASSVAAYELLPVSEVEWNGLLRFRDPSAPPNTLNWAQARRLVQAAITWHAWDPPTNAMLLDIANGKMEAPSVPVSPRYPPSVYTPSGSGEPGYRGAGAWVPTAAMLNEAYEPVPVQRPSSFSATVEESIARNKSLSRHSLGLEGSKGGSARGREKTAGSTATGTGSAPPTTPTAAAAAAAAAAASGDVNLMHPHYKVGAHNMALVSAGEWAGGIPEPASALTAQPWGSKQPWRRTLSKPGTAAGSPTRAAASSAPPRIRRTRRARTRPREAPVMPSYEPPVEEPPMTRRGAGGLEELGAMRVAPRAVEPVTLSPRVSPRNPAANAPLAARPRRPVGLGLASAAVAHNAAAANPHNAARHGAFSGKTLFADTLRRREHFLARAAAAHENRYSPRHVLGELPEGAAPPPTAAPSEPAPLPIPPLLGEDAVESQYAWMDQQLLDELAGIARDEMEKPFDMNANRQMRAELALLTFASQQRIGVLNHGKFDIDGMSPTLAKRALKEGLRTPLELVRTEVRARMPYRKSYTPLGVPEVPEPQPPFQPTMLTELPEGARELPPMA